MSATRASLQLDRVNLVIHWVLLAITSLYLGWTGWVGSDTVILLAAAGGWTLLLTALSFAGRRLPYHRIVVLAADLIVSYFLFQMVRISGTFLTKVFEGPYKDAGKWARTMTDYVKNKAKQMEKMYFFYTTCPKCARFYGKNYTVLLAKV